MQSLINLGIVCDVEGCDSESEGSRFYAATDDDLGFVCEAKVRFVTGRKLGVQDLGEDGFVGVVGFHVFAAKDAGDEVPLVFFEAEEGHHRWLEVACYAVGDGVHELSTISLRLSHLQRGVVVRSQAYLQEPRKLSGDVANRTDASEALVEALELGMLQLPVVEAEEVVHDDVARESWEGKGEVHRLSARFELEHARGEGFNVPGDNVEEVQNGAAGEPDPN